MSYKEFKPSNRLENIVDSYWFFSSLKQVENERILPDGCMDIIFNFGTDTNFNAKNTIYVSGMMTRFSDISFDKNTDLLGIRFKSGIFNKLTKFPLFEIKNETIDASIIIPEFNLETMERLQELKYVNEKIQLIENLILNILDTKNTSSDSLVLSVIESMHNSSIPKSFEIMAKDHCISLRQLERKFKHQVGVTAKEYHRIVRFIKTQNNIKSQKNGSLLDIALNNGYFDHSHLTNEFKRFSGQNPSVFR